MKHNGLHRRITLPLVCLGCLHRMGFAPAQDFTQHCDASPSTRALQIIGYAAQRYRMFKGKRGLD